MLNWYLAYLNPVKHPPSFWVAFLLNITIGLVLAYFLPWLTSKVRSHVTVYERCIVRSSSRYNPIRFTKMTSFTWQSAAGYSTLIFTNRRGKQIFVGVPLDIPTDALTAFLSERISPNQLE